ncbi:hypothetical protein OCU04_012236 [Sclerotinia nivalis]|uniref:Uncharacterized protein n=1 Tax=Sclerotinia nivalis TaxID=352851 RepID=A0A9X0AAL6_9HELO|nr:hypothetical protein OCU04_012236 [Sclerotinia nivalis]
MKHFAAPADSARMNNTIVTIAIIPPVESPLLDEEVFAGCVVWRDELNDVCIDVSELDEEVFAGYVVCRDELNDVCVDVSELDEDFKVDVNVSVIDGLIWVVVAAEEKAFKSLACHQTGIPSPKIIYGDQEAIVVRGVLASVETHEFKAFSEGLI